MADRYDFTMGIAKSIKKCLFLACLFLFCFSAVGPTVIGVVTAIPAQNVVPAGAVCFNSINTIEISGRASGGTGVLHILRRTYTSSLNFQYRPWAEDRAIDPFADATISGYVSARYRVPENTFADECFVILNPGGTVTIDGTVPLIARGNNY